MTIILCDGEHCAIGITPNGRIVKPSPSEIMRVILRLYSDKAIAGYVLAGVPEVVSLNVYSVWRNPAYLGESVTR